MGTTNLASALLDGENRMVRSRARWALEKKYSLHPTRRSGISLPHTAVRDKQVYDRGENGFFRIDSEVYPSPCLLVESAR